MGQPSFTESELTTALNRAKIALMNTPDVTFYTTVLFSLKFEWSDRVATAATNGLKLLFNPKFFMFLSPAERVFVLVHEALHVAFMHSERAFQLIHSKFNIAADHVINIHLIDRGFTMPKMGLADFKYRGLGTEEVYRLLPDNPPINPMEDLLEPDEGSTEIRTEVENILIRAAVQSRMENDKPGTIPGEIEIFLNKLLNPKLPWQSILRKYFQSHNKTDYTFRKPNRRFFPKHHLPSLYSESLMHIAIAVDASGSVTDSDFNQFISETNGILKFMKPEKISLIQFDTQIKSVDEVKSVTELSRVKFQGRGGTNVHPVLDWAEENKPKVLLIFTDGYFPLREDDSTVDIVWLIHNNKKFNASFGKIIHYEI